MQNVKYFWVSMLLSSKRFNSESFVFHVSAGDCLEAFHKALMWCRTNDRDETKIHLYWANILEDCPLCKDSIDIYYYGRNNYKNLTQKGWANSKGYCKFYSNAAEVIKIE